MLNPSYVVGIGASAGGLEALQAFFDRVSPRTSFAFVVVQHLSSKHESMMDELLGRHTSLPITVITKPVALEGNHVYLISHRHNLIVDGSRLKPTDKAAASELNLPIDAFFHSLAESYAERAIGVILSGTGTDGSRGAKSIREQGGIIIVQSPETAKFEGMPQATLTTGADLSLPVEDIAQEVNRLATDVPTSATSYEDVSPEDDQLLHGILRLVHDETGNDFRQHRTPTLFRRIDKRAKIVRTGSLSDYYQYLSKHPNEVRRLAEEFSVSVSRFFRNKEVWQVFAHSVVPELFQKKEDGDTVRVWVPGCSTSEEAYTIAILLSEYQSHHRYVDFKIFATDIDQRALSRAGSGEYPTSVAHDLEPFLLERYFRKTDSGYKVNKNIRDKVVFAVHNLISDPPFIRMDLISCRNTLIYIKPPVQQRILKNFHYSLYYHGYLILGTNENLGDVRPAFEKVASGSNVFRNVQKEKFDRFSSLSVPPPLGPRHRGPTPIEKRDLADKNFTSDYYAAILVQEHVPVAIFVDADASILYINGDVSPMLKFPQKQARLNLLDMVEKKERRLIQNGIRRVWQKDKSIRFENVKFRDDEGAPAFDLRFKEVWQAHLKKNIILIEFIATDHKLDADAIDAQPGALATEQIEMLEHEIQHKNQELQSLTAQLETSNEELQASNEELQASNEELQSSNEELQSVNEELYTVNGELQQKINEVVEYSNDINNLLASTDIATIFLDQALNVRTITPRIEEIINIGQQDLGRPFRNYVTQLKRNYLEKDIRRVQESDKSIRRAVETKAGQHYYCQVLPYRKSDGKPEGIVITFVNITDLKQAQAGRKSAEKKNKDTRNRLEMVIESVKVGIWEYTPSTGRVEWNRHMLELFDFERDTFDRTLETALARVHPDDQESVRTAMRHTLANEARLDLEYRVVWQDNSIHYIYTQGRMIAKGRSKKLVGTCVDLTDRKAAEEEALQYGQLLENSHNEIYICDARTLRFVNVNQGALKNIGYRLNEMRNLTLLDITSELSRQQFQYMTNDLDRQQEDNVQFETTHRRKNGSRYPVLINLQATRYRDQEVYVLIVQDITEQALSTDRLKESNRQLKIANDYLDNFVFTAAHDLRAPVANLLSLNELLAEQDQPNPRIVDKIGTSVKRLDNTLSGLIKILNIQQYGKEEAEEVNFEHLLSLIVSELDPHIKETNARISTDFAAPTICYIQPYLESVLRNLLSNALKYRADNQDPSIQVSTKSHDGYVQLRVADNGIGIDLDRFGDKLFKPFERLTRRADGKGIGLHLIKTMVEKNGGRVEVESQPDRGTTFIAYLQSYEYQPD